jgi:hypothetical protein
MLAATNVAVVGIALWQRWPLVVLLWPYWLQSVIIGWYSRRRILELRQFSLEDTSGFDAGSDEKTRLATAKFFTFHYGFFHLGYFVFLWVSTTVKVTPLHLVFLLAIAISFALTHRASYQRIMESDAAGKPNIGAVMFLPYLRIVPMHAAIIFGLGMFQGMAWGVLVFGILKTIADLAMHVIEYRITAPKLESPA